MRPMRWRGEMEREGEIKRKKAEKGNQQDEGLNRE